MPQYTVGLRARNAPGHVTVEAEDALIAALKAKHDHPTAAITYARKANARGDKRHPPPRLARARGGRARTPAR